MVSLVDLQKAFTVPNYPLCCPPEKTTNEYAEEWEEWFEDTSTLLMKLFQQKEQVKVSVDRKQLTDLLAQKRKEWKIAYPLKTKFDFQTRVLIDEIFDELTKELLESEARYSKKEVSSAKGSNIK